jgi:hypothetical protein
MSTEATRLVDSNGQTYGKRGDEEAGFEDVETFTYGDFIKVSKPAPLVDIAAHCGCSDTVPVQEYVLQ